MSNVVCIAGMHRSGTSLTAQWLQHCGLFIGDELLGPASSNKYGHFEDVDFLKIHKEDLIAKGLHISGLLLPAEGEYKLNHATAKTIVEKRNEDRQQWGWKEPRSTLYLMDWKRYISGMRCLMLFREPSLVITSLYERLKMNKWYYTRNPIKRFKWYVDIDLNPRKWYKVFSETYVKYNQVLLKFHDEYPDDSILVSLNTLTEKSIQVHHLMQNKWNIQLRHAPITDILDSNVLHKSKKLIPYASIVSEEARNIYLKLKESSSLS